MTEGHIVDLLTDTLVVYLEDKLKFGIPESDESRSALIRGGRLQEDPTRLEAINYVLIQEGDPEHEGWIHQGNSIVDNPTIDTGFTFEMGGGSLFWRRMSIEVGGYYIIPKYDRNQARDHFHRFIGRTAYYTQHSIIDRTSQVLGLKDEFGEEIIGLYVVKERYNESGGPPKSFIWRGRINFDVLTHRSW